MTIQPAARDHSSLFGTVFYMFAGPLLWAVHFTLVYGGHTLLCRLDAERPIAGISPSALVIGGATILAVGMLIVFALAKGPAGTMLRLPKEPVELRRFLDGLMLWLVFLSGAGIIWSGVTILVLDACAQLR